MRLNSEHPITTENKQKPAEYTLEVVAKIRRQRLDEKKIQQQQQLQQQQNFEQKLLSNTVIEVVVLHCDHNKSTIE